MSTLNPDLLYQIALTQVDGIGPLTAKKLVSHCGSAEQVFKSPPDQLAKIEGVGKFIAGAFKNKKCLSRAEQEIAFIEKNAFTALSFLDKAYPRRLKNCDDGPLVLFQKGNVNLNANRTIAVVGTRSSTEYGQSFCEKFIADLAPYNALVISGLAYGIDAHAHGCAVKNKIPTIGVLAHGLDTIYPYLNRKLSENMLAAGGALVTEFLSQSKPDRENFPKRNRIIAGISDAVLVVEAAKKGGALITAQIGNSYHRDVFAVPGKVGDKFSEGCNLLIKSNQASLFTGVKDLEYIMGWRAEEPGAQQMMVFENLNPDEQLVIEQLEQTRPGLEIDVLAFKTKQPVYKLLPTLMNLELKNLVKALPGKVYKLN